jgi:hypothetical protein
MMEHTTERGVTIQVIPIPMLLDEIRKAHPEPEPVTYTAHMAGGATLEIAISERDAALWRESDPEGWSVHAERWAEYEARVEERTRLLSDALWRAVMRRAVVVDIPPDSEWVPEHEGYGITVPAGVHERRHHYIWTEVLGGRRDVLRIMALANGSNITEEQLSAIEASFWDTLPRPASLRATDQARAVDVGDARDPGPDSEGVGQAAE